MRWLLLSPKFWSTNVILATVLAVAIFQFVQTEQNKQQAIRNSAESLGKTYVDKIARQARISVSSTWALDAYLKVDQFNVTVSNFDEIAAGIIQNYQGISNLQLAPLGTVMHIYPLKDERQDNTGAIGHALMVDPNRRGGAVSTIEKAQTAFIGPVTLVQGGFAVIARHPVFTQYAPEFLPTQSWTSNSGETFTTDCSTQQARQANCHFPGPDAKDGSKTYFWGFVTMLSLMTDFLQTAELHLLEQQAQQLGSAGAMRFDYQVWTTSDPPVLIAHSSGAGDGVSLVDPVEIDIDVPSVGIKWNFHLAPSDGWPPFSVDFWLQLVLVILLTLALGIGIGFMSVGNLRATYVRKRELEKEREFQLNLKACQGRDSFANMAHPMVVINASKFLQLKENELRSLHEGVRDMHRLTILDTLDDVTKFFAIGQRRAVIFSYQWLSWSQKGPDAVQLEAMRSALHFYQKDNGVQMDDIYLWLDILAIPQCNREMQQLAVYSLYIYASKVNELIIIAPDSVHSDTGEVANAATYKSRVWTRVEQLAVLISSSPESIKMWKPTGLEQVGDEWLRSVVSIFDADMTCCRLKHKGLMSCDKESLVKPLLGMWYKVLRDKQAGTESKGARIFFKYVQEMESSIFPKSFTFEAETYVEQRELFGDLLRRVSKLALDSPVSNSVDLAVQESANASDSDGMDGMQSASF
eukprot:gb/GFBE01050506.1/.p1 GENE.gb/GFBE01050506.1/~~gb/GFBE01050506.1/.p1  ORF type:complete len:694 (+),score=174.43 gb/GFBE01050506.1/:1-2082(+)